MSTVGISGTNGTRPSGSWSRRAPFAELGLGPLIIPAAIAIQWAGSIAIGAFTYQFLRNNYGITKENLEFSFPAAWLEVANDLNGQYDLLDKHIAQPGGACFKAFWHPEEFHQDPQEVGLARSWADAWRMHYRQWKLYYYTRLPIAQERAEAVESVLSPFTSDNMDKSDTIALNKFSGILVAAQSKASKWCHAEVLATPFTPEERKKIARAVEAKEQEGNADWLGKIGKLSDALVALAWVGGISVVGYFLLQAAPALRAGSRTAEAYFDTRTTMLRPTKKMLYLPSPRPELGVYVEGGK